jgi:hypothetical protein
MPRAYLFLDTMPPMGQELMSTNTYAEFQIEVGLYDPYYLDTIFGSVYALHAEMAACESVQCV